MSRIYIKVDLQYSNFVLPVGEALDQSSSLYQVVNGQPYTIISGPTVSNVFPTNWAGAVYGNVAGPGFANPGGIGGYGRPDGSSQMYMVKGIAVDYSFTVPADLGKEPTEAVAGFASTPTGIEEQTWNLPDYIWTWANYPDGPTLSVAISTPVQEPAAGATSSATFTVSLSAAVGYDVSFSYATASGTAISGSDFTSTSGGATIKAGDTQTTVSVPVLADNQTEPTESFTLTISNPYPAARRWFGDFCVSTKSRGYAFIY